jgi:hypothetical protein
MVLRCWERWLATPACKRWRACQRDVGTHVSVAGAALSALITANAPALHEVNVLRCALGDAGLGPLVDALPANTHLRTLDVSDNDKSEAFSLQRLLPAVRANSGLRELSAGYYGAVLDAEALVAARTAVGADAAQQR